MTVPAYRIHIMTSLPLDGNHGHADQRWKMLKRKSEMSFAIRLSATARRLLPTKPFGAKIRQQLGGVQFRAIQNRRPDDRASIR